jgi:tetratricopeptide (TPR) repeat protein
MLYYMANADVVEASRAREQCELLTLRAGATNDTRLTRWQTSAFLYPYADDLMGLKRTLEGLELVCAKRPGWRFTRDLCRAHVLRCRGKLDEALAVLERSLAVLPDAHYDFGPSAEAHLLLLTQLGRLNEALAMGTQYIERAQALDIPTAWLELALSLCLAALDRHADAETHWRTALSALSGRDIGGVHLGYAYEVGARIALRRDDQEAFAERRDRCAQYYLPGRYPALAAKYNRLVEAADTSPATKAASPSSASALGPIQMQTALSQCRDRLHRGEQALGWLCEQTGASSGFLFGLRGGFLEPLADESVVPPDMLAVAQSYFGRELEGALDVTLTEMFDGVPKSDVSSSRLPGYVPILLRATDELGEFVVGVAMLQLRGPLRMPSPRFLLSLSQVLLAMGDVERTRIRA